MVNDGNEYADLNEHTLSALVEFLDLYEDALTKLLLAIDDHNAFTACNHIEFKDESMTDMLEILTDEVVRKTVEHWASQLVQKKIFIGEGPD